MNFRSSEERSPFVPLDLTAMVDLVFLLIIFFLTTSNFVEKNITAVDLPEDSGGDILPQREASSLIINLTRNGTIIVAGQELTIDALDDKVRAEIAAAGTGPTSLDLLLRADRAVPLARVNEVARRLTDQGVRHWRIANVAIEPESAAPEATP